MCIKLLLNVSLALFILAIQDEGQRGRRYYVKNPEAGSLIHTKLRHNSGGMP